jgi:hypothetical protein
MGSNLGEILENVCYLEFFLSFLNDKEKKKKLVQKKMSFLSLINNLLVGNFLYDSRNQHKPNTKLVG